jgi:hypothetical protein
MGERAEAGIAERLRMALLFPPIQSTGKKGFDSSDQSHEKPLKRLRRGRVGSASTGLKPPWKSD